MRVLHLCLSCFYIDKYSYQENMLPKYHKLLGYDVAIIASLVSFDENGEQMTLSESGEYINEYGIPVTRLAYKTKNRLSRLLRHYEGTLREIEEYNPDIMFVHGIQFIDVRQIIKYKRKHPATKIYIDNHSDFSNSALNWISKNIQHKILWRYYAHKVSSSVEKFYGVLPARVDFLADMYGLPRDKIELLVMGADDELVATAKSAEVRKSIREKYGINEDDFLIMTGGKIDSAKKQTLLLMEAVKGIEKQNVKLIVFGSVIDNLKTEIQTLSDGDRIQYIGWIQSNDAYAYFAAADLVVFPGRHSVFWEQVAGLGVPMIVKHWEGTTHIDVGGNCDFLYEDSVVEIQNKIQALINNPVRYEEMKRVAETKGMDMFSYRAIAEKSLS